MEAPVEASHLIYLHGFASGPGSLKAKALQERCADLARVHVPDLEPDGFFVLTPDSHLAAARTAVQAVPAHEAVLLVGSSLGGWNAVRLLAEPRPGPTALLLLAPAFGFTETWTALLGDEALAHWQQQGQLAFPHARFDDEEQLLSSCFHDVCQQVDPWPPLPANVPICILHGRRDETIPWQQSWRYAEHDPRVELLLLDAGHGLAEPGDLDLIVTCARRLLQRLAGE
jgi:uncharacterized protein